MNIMNFIPVGKENAISREALRVRLNLPDRAVRLLIQEARERGEIILNTGDGAGYFVSDDIGEIERQYRQDTGRALSILKRRKAMRKILKDAGREV